LLKPWVLFVLGGVHFSFLFRFPTCNIFCNAVAGIAASSINKLTHALPRCRATYLNLSGVNTSKEANFDFLPKLAFTPNKKNRKLYSFVWSD
jgi:hypothetical protein